MSIKITEKNEWTPAATLQGFLVAYLLKTIKKYALCNQSFEL